jgi:hypothetical protein
MRIIPDGILFIIQERRGRRLRRYNIEDTIEITDAEWDRIGRAYKNKCQDALFLRMEPVDFSKYLNELIKLKQ